MSNDYFNHDQNRITANTRATAAQINNIGDELAAAFDKIPDEAEIRGETVNLATNTSGDGDALTAALSYTPSLSDGFRVRIRCPEANTGNVTLNLNSLGIKSVLTSDLQQIPAGGIVADTIIDMYYDSNGDQWVVGQKITEAGGSDTELQYNSNGQLLGMAEWTYNISNGKLSSNGPPIGLGNFTVDGGLFSNFLYIESGASNQAGVILRDSSENPAVTLWGSTTADATAVVSGGANINNEFISAVWAGTNAGDVRIRAPNITTIWDWDESDGAHEFRVGVGSPKTLAYTLQADLNTLYEGSIALKERADHIRTPAAGVIEFWARSSDNAVIATDSSGTDTVLGGGGGVWTELVNETPAAASPWEHTWDETSYSDIKIVLEDVQCSLDGRSLWMAFGADDGGTIYTTSSDYEVWEMSITGSPGWGASGTTDKITLVPNTSNAANETISGTIDIMANGSAGDTGVYFFAQIYYINATSSKTVMRFMGWLDQNDLIDTVRLYWPSGTFQNTGNIAIFGLSR